MRVLLCTNSRDRGSTSRTLEAWSRLLPEHGVSPAVAVGGDGPLATVLRQAGTPVFHHPIRIYFEPSRPLPFLWEISRLALRIRRSRIDLVHLNEHDHYPVVARAAYLANVPAIVHLRFRPDADVCRWLFRAPYRPARLFFTSQTQMNDSATAVESVVPRARWRLIYNGLDFNTFGRAVGSRDQLRASWGLEAGTIAIGTASSISPRKRLDHFVRLIAALRGMGVAAKGFIAGQPYFPEDHVELAALRALVTALGMSDSVQFLGYVEPAEPLYHAWDICVSTSAYETFGMTLLEAMACRCPVVSYPGGSVSEVVGDGGAIVPDGDEGALAAAAWTLAMDPVCREQAKRAARARAEYFNVERSVEQLAAEYRAVLTRGPS